MRYEPQIRTGSPQTATGGLHECRRGDLNSHALYAAWSSHRPPAVDSRHVSGDRRSRSVGRVLACSPPVVPSSVRVGPRWDQQGYNRSPPSRTTRASFATLYAVMLDSATSMPPSPRRALRWLPDLDSSLLVASCRLEQSRSLRKSLLTDHLDGLFKSPRDGSSPSTRASDPRDI